MKPMLDPKRDLVGATPEKLARALFRPLRRGRREDTDDTGVVVMGQSTVSDDGGEHANDRMRPVTG